MASRSKQWFTNTSRLPNSLLKRSIGPVLRNLLGKQDYRTDDRWSQNFKYLWLVLFSFEQCRPFLEKGPRTFLCIFGLTNRLCQEVLQPQSLRKGKIHPPVNCLFGRLYGKGRIQADPFSQFRGFGEQLIRRHNPVDKPDPISFLSIDPFSGEYHLQALA